MVCHAGTAVVIAVLQLLQMLQTNKKFNVTNLRALLTPVCAALRRILPATSANPDTSLPNVLGPAASSFVGTFATKRL